jgi:hypothetical protein
MDAMTAERLNEKTAEILPCKWEEHDQLIMAPKKNTGAPTDAQISSSIMEALFGVLTVSKILHTASKAPQQAS